MMQLKDEHGYAYEPEMEPICLDRERWLQMATDDRRREAAKRLREPDVSGIEVDGCAIDSPGHVGLLLMRMLDAARGYRDGLHRFPGFLSARAAVELFADPIDRPATSIGVNKHGRACRTNCGCDDRCLASDGNARYRPGCGAEALDEDGAN